MNRRTALSALAGGVVRGLARGASDPSFPAVLVELFTSEGCSSCPPADRLLTDLQQRPPAGAEVIVLSEHVDYWNHLGWEDPFSSSLFSARQHQYSMKFRKESVYTPQMVVDGRAEALGSDASAVRALIIDAAQRPHATVRLHVRQDDESENHSKALLLHVEVSPAPKELKDRRWHAMLAVTESGLASSVSRGENAGRRLMHTGVVRQFTRIAELDKLHGNSYSADLKLSIQPQWNRDLMRAVVFVQSPDSHIIIGSGSCRI